MLHPLAMKSIFVFVLIVFPLCAAYVVDPTEGLPQECPHFIPGCDEQRYVHLFKHRFGYPYEHFARGHVRDCFLHPHNCQIEEDDTFI
ncbi:hypothetical protein QR680_013762 [Steinernema hermaphroditum]|uniref:BPTI/Kunitz inhibitor domain-containing protein n=1 Tax=Steinernema hermaphroditum TaxID=289476 RepID=A0AA39I6K4_9BILA|nr:hypothetical protein QR680_013762 [Steinernema hermaphroditum]